MEGTEPVRGQLVQVHTGIHRQDKKGDHYCPLRGDFQYPEDRDSTLNAPIASGFLRTLCSPDLHVAKKRQNQGNMLIDRASLLLRDASTHISHIGIWDRQSTNLKACFSAFSS